MTDIVTTPDVERMAELEGFRRELTGHCYRMLGSPFDAEDAVQETFVRAWRGLERFEGRAALRTWLYRIATNVCLDLLRKDQRRVRAIDLGPAGEPTAENLRTPEVSWLEPLPDSLIERDPADIAQSRESVRLAFVAALQRLPARQRAALILCEVLDWKAAEVAELLETSVASVNSALQRARATLKDVSAAPATDLSTDDAQRALVERFARAFERYDIDELTSLIRSDAIQSMPPYDLWLAGREDVLRWWFGPGIGCRGSRLLPTAGANGLPAFGQYKPSATGDGHEPWALLVVEPSPEGIAEMTFFLDTARLFPLFGLPLRLPA